MAISQEVQHDLLATIVGIFDGAPTFDIFNDLADRLNNGATVAELADELTATREFQEIYSTGLTANQFASKFVSSLLGDNVTADTKELAVEFVEGLVNGGASFGTAAYQAIQALSTVSEDDATWGQAAKQLNNKVDVATTFALTTDFTNLSMAELKSVTAGVDASDESVTDKKVLIQAGILDEAAQTQRLTTGQDFLKGTALADVFKAVYFDNQNTLQSGDEIDGGLGVDTLFAKISNSNDSAINVETTSVEIAKFQAQEIQTDSADNEIAGDRAATQGQGDTNGSAAVDAQDMNGTVEFWSINSRADLVIEDVRNDSHKTTLVMQDTDAGDVDYAVYFSPNDITAPDAAVQTSLYLEILDLEAAAATGDKLTNNPYVGVKISVGGVEYTIAGDTPITSSYEDLVAALNAALDAAGLTSVTASLGEQFSKFNSDDGELYSGTTIVLTNDGSEELGGIGWIADDVVPADTNVHTKINNVDPTVSTELTQVDIELDNVGRGSESGDFRAGNMSTGDSGSQGIQQFNVLVHDSSWITSMSTTNDDLEVVIVENSTEMLDMGTNGDLRIGDNGNDDGYAGIQNVRVFDASAMTGNVTLDAIVDDAAIAKYNDFKDVQNGIQNDNIEFDYSTGTGDDVIELTVSEEAVSYEDFELTVETGTGDDEVIFEVTGTATDNLDTNWNEDQAALDNIMIATGAGNDTVRTLGDGEVTITTGSGNDVVYSDNSGLDSQAATWVFNAENTEIDDLQGSGSGTEFFMYNSTVTVTFSGGSTGAGVTAPTAGEFTNGFESSEVSIDLSGYVATMGDINQALKEAINNDATLSQWLVAKDGPNNSVVVSALVDGVYQNDDLLVTIDQGDLSALTSIPSAVQSAWEDFNADSGIVDIDDGDLDDQLADILAASANSGYTTVNADDTTFNGAAVLATQGDAVAEVQTLNFAGVTADNAATYTVNFAGESITYTLGSGTAVGGADDGTSASIAEEVASQINNDAAGFTATFNGTTVTITATAGTDYATAQVIGVDVGGAGVDEAALAADVDVDTVTNGVAAGSALTGVASDEEANNNTINLGSGNDVLALSTNDDSAETIVFTGTDIGNNDVLNFALAEDKLDFTAYLTDIQTKNGSTSSESEKHIDITANSTVTIGGGIDLSSNEVVILNDFAEDTTGGLTETWANLTAANLKAALNNVNTASSDDYANIGDAGTSWTEETTTDGTYDFDGSSMKNIIMIENDLNDGEYKVFEVTSAVGGTITEQASTVTLLGTVDFGEEIDQTVAVIA